MGRAPLIEGGDVCVCLAGVFGSLRCGRMTFLGPLCVSYQSMGFRASEREKGGRTRRQSVSQTLEERESSLPSTTPHPGTVSPAYLPVCLPPAFLTRLHHISSESMGRELR
mmetsp:Transcript_7050/g.20443  ORF Transcript_7050/g.20443 Transcript_7050/m.20443 type:complete len:111 (+) Transcript_7050:1883-2215(+)